MAARQLQARLFRCVLAAVVLWCELQNDWCKLLCSWLDFTGQSRGDCTLSALQGVLLGKSSFLFAVCASRGSWEPAELGSKSLGVKEELQVLRPYWKGRSAAPGTAGTCSSVGANGTTVRENQGLVHVLGTLWKAHVEWIKSQVLLPSSLMFSSKRFYAKRPVFHFFFPSFAE